MNIRRGVFCETTSCFSLLVMLVAIMFSSCSNELPEKRVLVFSKTDGYRHESISVGKMAIMKLGEENGFRVDTTENANFFVTDSLKRYSAVVFLNTTQNVLDYRQQAHFERYVQAGGGFVGIHSAADTEYHWPWYVKLVGASFESHPEQQNANIDVLDHDHLSTQNLPEKWERFDEWYNYKNINPNVNVLATLDESTYKGGKNGDPHPIAWYHEFDGGRAFYTGLGHTKESYSEPEFLQHLSGGINYAIGDNILDYDLTHSPLPPDENNFVKDVLIQRLDEPTELEVFDGGKILFAQRKGELILYDLNNKSTKTIAKINVNNTFEDGLVGLAKDPNYNENHWIYLYYAPAGDEWVNVLSRFVFIADTLLQNTEKVMLKVPVQRATCCHTGGSIEFGPGGLLYLSTGDDTNPFNDKALKVNAEGNGPMNDLPGWENWDARRSSANTNDLRGKILRIKPEVDGTYSIPDGNLFPKDGSQGKPEIYVMGCRNPYRISIDQKTGILYYGDVGPDASENTAKGPRGHDEVNQVKEPGFFGWPLFVGNNFAYADIDYQTGEIGPLYDPLNPINNSPNNTGMRELPPAQPAMVYYPYAVSKEFEDLGTGGRNAMAGPVYYSNLYKNSEYKLSSYYDGKFFFYDWIRDWIMAATFDENHDLIYYEPFLPSVKFANIMDFTIGPDGVIYMLEYGTNWFTMNNDATLSRILYSDGNKIPIAVAEVNSQYGSAPFTVSLNAANSYDFDAKDKLSYSWILDDEEISTEESFDYTIDQPGVYQFTLAVSDQHGETGEEMVAIYVGNSYPEVDIDFAGNRSFYWDGREIDYSVKVNDQEDGKYPGEVDENKIAFTIDYLEGFDKTMEEAGHQVKADLLNGAQLIEDNNCFACHRVDEESNGPMYIEVAKRYVESDQVTKMLSEKIINGGSGNWGERMMSANPNVTQEEAAAMVKYILSLNDTEPKMPLSGTYAFDEHTSNGNGNYQFKLTYKDKGANGIEPLSTTKTYLFKPTTIEAEDYSDVLNGRPLDLRDNVGRGVSRLENDSYLVYQGIDLSGVTAIKLVCSSSEPVRIEIRQGGVDGMLVAENTFNDLSDHFSELSMTVRGQNSQLSDLYLIFKGEADFERRFFIDKLKFEFSDTVQ